MAECGLQPAAACVFLPRRRACQPAGGSDSLPEYYSRRKPDSDTDTDKDSYADGNSVRRHDVHGITVKDCNKDSNTYVYPYYKSDSTDLYLQSHAFYAERDKYFVQRPNRLRYSYGSEHVQRLTDKDDDCYCYRD